CRRPTCSSTGCPRPESACCASWSARASSGPRCSGGYPATSTRPRSPLALWRAAGDLFLAFRYLAPHGPPLRGLLLADHVHDGVDERQVRERLREVAQLPARARVDLLAVEQQRAGVGQDLLADVTGPLVLADLAERRNQPERADGERALLAGEPVVGLVALVAQHQAVPGQLVRA